jgi:hypothetical protein
VKSVCTPVWRPEPTRRHERRAAANHGREQVGTSGCLSRKPRASLTTT